MTNQDFISHADAIKRFISAGSSESTFRRKVKEHPIHSKLPEGRVRGAEYLLKDILEVLAEFEKKGNQGEESKEEGRELGETDWIKNTDVGNMYNLEYKAYGDETGNPSIVRKWYERNRRICRILYNKQDRRDFWGAINMLPLREETIFRLLKGEMRDIDLDPQKDILTFDDPGTYNFYVASVLVDSEKREHFPLLINSLFGFWVDQAPARAIGKIYGRLVSKDGELMAKKLFFSPRWDISDSAYMLDLNRPNPSRFIQTFQHCIELKKQETQNNTI